ncbi:MAG: hypothetical protein IKT58_05955 [Oscillospiraceae bacterium]|nr:hypothetical protein [Oscillospiraceae bacterium]
MSVLLWSCLLLSCLCGCSGGKSVTPQGKPTEATEPASAQKSELLETMDQAVAFVDEMMENGVERFTLVCSKEVYDALTRTTLRKDDAKMYAYNCLLGQAGLYDYKIVTAGAMQTIYVIVLRMYPGYEILRSVNNGTEDQLSYKLKQTLAEAKAIADACRTTDPLETAENIQKAICERVVYANMTNMSDVDTAIAPLLDGAGDCDGYADAFYLIGGLAGLEVRCLQGTSRYYDHEASKIVSGGHMWNALKLDGTWRVVDVCWADSDDGVDYTWFNIGKDRASRSRLWEEDLSVPLLETTDLSTRPETEYSVTSYAELEAAIQGAVAKEQSFFTLIFDRADYCSKSDAFNILMDVYPGEAYYFWDECTRVLTIYTESQ